MDAQRIVHLTGTGVHYNYRELPAIPDERLERYIRDTRKLCGDLIAQFDETQNTEWFIRHYLALKFILGATVLGTSALFAQQSNLKSTLPYLNYYMILNSCRAFLLTLPCLPWRGTASIEMTHNAIINTSADKLKRLGSSEAAQLGEAIRAAKAQRDLFSYRFPSSGLSIFGKDLITVERAVQIARLVTELAQVNSTCLEAAAKKSNRSYDLLELEDVWHLMTYSTKAEELIDDEDYSRVGYFYRKYKAPTAVVLLATDGLVEDFFGAWEADDEQNAYDPTVDYDLLLDLR